ncbi:MAG: plasmid mobilization relaxosome protein MobC [Proteobacteria bacterium]|nr:MAG: plasmid mobilization relaxosome protein MobC [Pseudomonadota bacterium]
MSKENPCLKVHLGKLKQPWVAYCATLGKKPGVAVKESIKQQLEEAGIDQPIGEPLKQTREASDDEVKHRFEILLTPSEKKAIEERAEFERCSQRRWVIDAIRAGLTKEPQFGMKEIETLGESNYQLLAIGRNLNQIAKALNEGRRDSVTLDSITHLRKIINQHTETVSTAIRASAERWEIE